MNIFTCVTKELLRVCSHIGFSDVELCLNLDLKYTPFAQILDAESSKFVKICHYIYRCKLALFQWG